MNTFERVKELINMGHTVAINYGAFWKVFTGVTASGNTLIGTSAKHVSLENATTNIHWTDSYSRGDFEDFQNPKITVITPAPTLLKVGDKVRVCDWYIDRLGDDIGANWVDSVEDKVLKINDISATYYVISRLNDEKICYTPFNAVYKVYEEEELTYEKIQGALQDPEVIELIKSKLND